MKLEPLLERSELLRDTMTADVFHKEFDNHLCTLVWYGVCLCPLCKIVQEADHIVVTKRKLKHIHTHSVKQSAWKQW